MNCNMLLKLSGQGAVYIRSNVKLDSGDSDHSDNDDDLLESCQSSTVAVKQEPEILEIPSEYDFECIYCVVSVLNYLISDILKEFSSDPSES